MQGGQGPSLGVHCLQGQGHIPLLETFYDLAFVELIASALTTILPTVSHLHVFAQAVASPEIPAPHFVLFLWPSPPHLSVQLPPGSPPWPP